MLNPAGTNCSVHIRITNLSSYWFACTCLFLGSWIFDVTAQCIMVSQHVEVDAAKPQPHSLCKSTLFSRVPSPLLSLMNLEAAISTRICLHLILFYLFFLTMPFYSGCTLKWWFIWSCCRCLFGPEIESAVMQCQLVRVQLSRTF